MISRIDHVSIAVEDYIFSCGQRLDRSSKPLFKDFSSLCQVFLGDLPRISHGIPSDTPVLPMATALRLPSLLDVVHRLRLRRSGCARLVSIGISATSRRPFVNNPG